MKKMKTGDSVIRNVSSVDTEHCWILIGEEKTNFWIGQAQNMTQGTPVSVEFDGDYVLEMEEKNQSIVGFFHLHPGMIASPSSRDYMTMRAWVNCFGKPLVCVIEGIDGLRAFWFDDDETDPIEVEVEQFGDTLVGSTIPIGYLGRDVNPDMNDELYSNGDPNYIG